MRPTLATPGRWLGVAALAVALAAPALAQRNVTLRMNSATMPDTIKADAAASGVQLRGGLESGTTTLPSGETIDWGSATTLVPDNDGGDYWSISFQIPDNDKLSFKFYFDQSEGANLPGGWEDNAADTGGNDYVIEAGTGDVSLDLHYFNKTGTAQPFDWRPFTAEGDSVGVWFRVYINTDEAVNKGLSLDDEGLVVGVRGAPDNNASQDGGTTTLNWDATDVVLSRESTDPLLPGYALFSGRAAFPAASIGATQAYKFVFSDSDSDVGWEEIDAGGDRSFTVPAQDSTLHWVFYGDSPAAEGTAVTANVTFQVDVSPLTSIGIFQTTDDLVQVRGGFNGWDCPADNQDDCALTQDIIIPTTYVNQIPVTALPGGEQFYKFFVDFRDANGDPQFTDASGNTIDVGWEEPLDYGGSDRFFEFAGTEQDLGTQFFNSIRAGNVIPAGTTVDVTFRVDMNPAMSYADQQGRTFDPATDTVTVQFEDPLWLITQGYTPGGDELVDTGGGGNAIVGLKLTDPSGDGVYTGTLTVNGPSYNALAYRYAFGNDTDGLQIEGTAGTAEGRRRYRYITNLGTGRFVLPFDAYRPTGPGTQAMPWEVNPTGTFTPDDFPNAIAVGADDPLYTGAVANEAGPGRSGALALEAAYPNPTAGLARMDVTAPADAAVTVRVYDVTGRLVTTLADGAHLQGARTFVIDTASMAPGLYVVRAEAGGDVVSRRLTVIR